MTKSKFEVFSFNFCSYFSNSMQIKSVSELFEDKNSKFSELTRKLFAIREMLGSHLHFFAHFSTKIVFRGLQKSPLHLESVTNYAKCDPTNRPLRFGFPETLVKRILFQLLNFFSSLLQAIQKKTFLFF